MRLSSSIGVSLLLIATLSGCTASDEAASPGGSYDAVDPPSDVSVSFDVAGTLTLSPGETATVEVATSPAGPYAITFLVVGDATDASLDTTSAVAGSDGRARVTLRAPDRPATFVLRARIKDGATADLPVSVSAQGFGSLVVEPQYDGKREVLQWRTGVLSGTTCEALADELPDDPPGALSGLATPDEELRVDDAPVGPSLAVYVRSKRYVWGCADEKDLEPDEVTTVEVPIFDKPIDLSEAALDLDLTFVPEPEPWGAITSGARDQLLASLAADGSVAATLLAAMSALSADPATFDTAATQNAWLDEVETLLQTAGFNASTTLGTWTELGLAAEAPEIVARIDALPDGDGHALLTLDRIGDATPTELAVPSDYVVTFDADPEDVVHLGGELFFLAGAYVANAAEQGALESTQASIGDALADAMGCDSIALPNFTSCDAACVVQLCRDATSVVWSDARAAAASASAGGIVMQVSGAAKFNQDAALTGFEGMWLGHVETAFADADVSGMAVAVPTLPAPE